MQRIVYGAYRKPMWRPHRRWREAAHLVAAVQDPGGQRLCAITVAFPGS